MRRGYGAQVSKLHNLLRPFLLRRLKSDVESSLPSKAEIVLYAHMTADQKRLNQQLKDRTVNVRFQFFCMCLIKRTGTL